MLATLSRPSADLLRELLSPTSSDVLGHFESRLGLVMKIRRTGQGDDVVKRFGDGGDDDMIKMIKPLIGRVLAMVLVVMVMMIVVMLTATISTS